MAACSSLRVGDCGLAQPAGWSLQLLDTCFSMLQGRQQSHIRFVHTALSRLSSEGHKETKESGTHSRLSLEHCSALQEEQQSSLSRTKVQRQGIASDGAVNIIGSSSASHLRRWRMRRQAVAEWMTWNSRLGLASQGRGL